MSLNEEVELLRNIPLFAKLEPSKLKLLAFTSERITYEADQVLFRQGDVGDAAYIIVEGAAAVLVETGEVRSKWRLWGAMTLSAKSPSCVMCPVPPQ